LRLALLLLAVPAVALVATAGFAAPGGDRAALAKASATAAQGLAQAATAGDWPAASAALDALNPPCRACHDVEVTPKKP